MSVKIKPYGWEESKHANKMIKKLDSWQENKVGFLTPNLMLLGSIWKNIRSEKTRHASLKPFSDLQSQIKTGGNDVEK